MLAFFRSVTTFRKRVQLGILLSTIGFVIWVYLVLTTRVWWIEPEFPLGLLQVLPLWFWIALVLHLAGILLTFDYENLTIFLLQIIFLNLIIVGTAVLVEPNARVNDSWLHFGTARTIFESGKITIQDSPTYWYLQYPFAFIFTTIFLGVSGIPQIAYLQFFPLLSSTFFLFGYYVWIRQLLTNRMCQKFCMIMLFLLNLWLRFHFNSQAFALILLPLLLQAFVKKGLAWKIVAVILTVSMVIFHPLTPVFLIILFGVECLVFLLLGKKPHYLRPLFLFIVWISWLRLYAVIYFERWVVSRTIQNILGGSLLQGTLTTELERHYIIPSMIRLIVFVLASIFAIWNIWQIRKNRGSSYAFYIAWLSSSLVIAALDLMVYQGEFADRFFVFATLLFPVLIAEFIWRKRTKTKMALALFMLILGVVNLSTLYYFENYWITSDTNVESARFVTTYGYSLPIYGHPLNVLQYFQPDINVTDVRFWTPGENIAQGSLIIYDPYTNASKYAGKLEALTSIYFGKIGDNIIYADGDFQVHQIVSP